MIGLLVAGGAGIAVAVAGISLYNRFRNRRAGSKGLPRIIEIGALSRKQKSPSYSRQAVPETLSRCQGSLIFPTTASDCQPFQRVVVLILKHYEEASVSFHFLVTHCGTHYRESGPWDWERSEMLAVEIVRFKRMEAR